MSLPVPPASIAPSRWWTFLGASVVVALLLLAVRLGQSSATLAQLAAAPTPAESKKISKKQFRKSLRTATSVMDSLAPLEGGASGVVRDAVRIAYNPQKASADATVLLRQARRLQLLTAGLALVLLALAAAAWLAWQHWLRSLAHLRAREAALSGASANNSPADEAELERLTALLDREAAYFRTAQEAHAIIDQMRDQEADLRQNVTDLRQTEAQSAAAQEALQRRVDELEDKK